MTASDPGLTDLIAADLAKHRFIPDEGDDEFGSCSCLTWRGPNHDRHVALVVEQHTNGRIAELAANIQHLSNNLDVARVGRATTEATIARVRGEVSAYSEIIPAVALADLRAALEGEL